MSPRKLLIANPSAPDDSYQSGRSLSLMVFAISPVKNIRFINLTHLVDFNVWHFFNVRYYISISFPNSSKTDFFTNAEVMGVIVVARSLFYILLRMFFFLQTYFETLNTARFASSQSSSSFNSYITVKADLLSNISFLL